jgi:ubiquinone/menaquinone biosynthesis C-methylase UbiE
MGHHTFDAAQADRLEGTERYRQVSAEELLGALALDGTETVLDVGSGTGFYTDDVAAAADRVLALDVQPAMHAFYREKGVPDTVSPVTAAADTLPVADGAVDAAFSTMTYHEFATPEALAELARVLAPGGCLVVADWSGDGPGESGPPVAERYTPADVREHLAGSGLALRRLDERPETFLFVAVAE